MRRKFKPEIITPPNTLKDKVTYSDTGVDLETLEKAENLITGMTGSYLEWVEEDLQKLQALYSKAVASTASRVSVLKEIFELSHDMKGQGGSFGYPLITQIGKQLCNLLERIPGEPDSRHLDIIRVHIEAMRVVITQRITGDGGLIGSNLLGGLTAATKKAFPSA